MNIAQYLEDIRKVHSTGAATEHAYRPALERLFSSIDKAVSAVNEPKSVKVGRPDFVFLREVGKGAQITVGHCEAKDIGLDINPKGMKDFNKNQYERYVKALPNLIYTNGLDFRFYKNGELAREISIADYLMGIRPKPDQFEVLANQLRDFAKERLQTITSAESLAEMMAGKAVLIKDILHNTLKEDQDLASELAGQFKAFKDQLIHDLDVEEFSDIYAETIAYGMFAARLHDETKETFTREEALALLPKSNPFLRNLFGYVAGPTLDEGIRRTVDELAEIFQVTDLQKLFENFGKFTQRNDPFIHFYETFLAEYNPAKRKARGVWYTPEPVVNFIVRAVDDVLKTEFGLADGLADTSKITVDWDTGQTEKGKPIITKKEIHRVQILDPAAGTGTFLAEVIKQIAPKVKDVAPGQWSKYVETELIPRLHGFELLMASYAMCHMKLDMMLTQMGYKPTGTNAPRLGVYLTNSLEEGEKVNQTLPFAQWLSNEAKQANTVKRDVPVMVVIGNPPYNSSSRNKNKWITEKISEYKVGLNETKINLDDDYIKFIRLAEYFIEKNSHGIISMITNNSYLDGITQRMMRVHLMETFDSIRILNLHGDIRNESTGVISDENVFDITQGVSIIVMSTNSKIDKTKYANVSYAELTGLRKSKYITLFDRGVKNIDFSRLEPTAPNYRFLPSENEFEKLYNNGFKISEFFGVYSSGIQTKRDNICIQFDKSVLKNVINDFSLLNSDELRQKYDIPDDGRDWKISLAKDDIKKSNGDIVPILYKPFDKKFTYYSGKTKGFLAYPRREVMNNVIRRNNISLLANRQTVKDYFSFVNVTDIACNHGTFYLGNRGQDYCFPLYLYPSESELDQTRRVNMDPKIRKAIEEAAMGKGVGGTPPSVGSADISPASGEIGARPDEVAIFDYIYGVLHCPAYRETYREFLKIDFPRIPYPPSPEVFWDVSAKGTALRRLHLMEDAVIGETPYPFTGEGGSVVGKVEYKPVGANGRVYINDEQCFENVPEIAWNFYIGGYQPAQKWLKDRKGRELSFDDIKHYRKIIKILTETDRIMKTIDMPLR